MIQLEALSCSYDAKKILDNINLEIEADLTLLGANGSGKSTLAKAICNLIPFEGKIKIDGMEMQSLSLQARAKRLSYIPPKLEIYDSFITVEEFVLMGRFPYKSNFFSYSAKDKKITQESLNFLHIAHLATQSVDALSSGEKQLLLIAQAVTQQSKIIIFDEPTANLDPKNSKIIAHHIKSLQESHQVILITHDIRLASFIGAPIAFIKSKKLTYYHKDDFFQPSRLQELYGVEFDALGVKYD